MSETGPNDAHAEWRSALDADPENVDARLNLGRAIRSQPLLQIPSYVERVAARINEEVGFIDDATVGWIYTLLMDDKFLATELERPEKSSVPQVDLPKPGREVSARDIFEELAGCETLTDLWEKLRGLPECREAALLVDSFENTPDDALSDALVECFGDDTVNIVILGAGCAGLTLANGLKSALGSHVSILLIEKRVESNHVKQAYSRHWLTSVPNSTVHGLVSSDVMDVLSRTGDDQIGVPINVFETLLLLSNKAMGVQLLFQSDYDLSFLKNTDDGARVHLVFDATGGRLHPPDDDAEAKPGPASVVPNVSYGPRDFTPFGVFRRQSITNYRVETLQVGPQLYPLHEGQRVQMAMFKVTRIPPHLYQDILDYLERGNTDCRFYIWPGTLRDEINEMLLLISLLPKEYKALAPNLPRSESLAEFLGVRRRLVKLDRRVGVLLKKIAAAVDDPETIRVEPPFVYRPYVTPYPQPFETLEGIPLIPTGDSIYNGNPKVGNGLGRHLRHVGRIVNAFLRG